MSPPDGDRVVPRWPEVERVAYPEAPETSAPDAEIVSMLTALAALAREGDPAVLAALKASALPAVCRRMLAKVRR